MEKKINNCIDKTYRGTNASVNEMGKTFILENRSGVKIERVKVDGCVYGDGDKSRCDYLFHVSYQMPAKPKAFFLELKGSDIRVGIQQLYVTISDLRIHYQDYTLEARLVTNRHVPDIKNVRTYINLKRMLKSSGGDIVIKNQAKYIESV